MNETSPYSLPAIREAIDDIDRQIVTLLCRRQNFVHYAAQLKTDESSVRAPERVKKVISRVREIAKQEGGSPEVVEKIYREIINSYINYELHEHRQSVRNSLS